MVGFAELGMEAIYEFDVKDMPVTVAVDSQGESVHQTGPTRMAGADRQDPGGRGIPVVLAEQYAAHRGAVKVVLPASPA